MRPIGFVLAILLATASTAYSRASLYGVYHLVDVCPQDGSKREINLGTGAGIFLLDENNPRTKRLLEEDRISCHLELETATGYGFHVFIDQMQLDEPPDSRPTGSGGECKNDFLQFGRDVFYMTTYRSMKFCGRRDRIEGNSSVAEIARASIQGNRAHIEKTDHEMDFWLKVGRRSKSSSEARKLLVIVTVFKNNCKVDDPYYMRCSNSNHCIRKDFFCDRYINCAWQNDDLPGDEKGCSNYEDGLYALGSSSKFLQPLNLPVIIIIVVVIGSFCLVVFLVLKKVLASIKKPSTSAAESEGQSLQTRSGGPAGTSNCHAGTGVSSDGFRSVDSGREPTEITPALHSYDVDSYPTAPPPYEEAVKLAPIGVHPTDPPPYSPPHSP